MEWVVHWIIVSQIQLAVLLKTEQERIKNDEELQGQRFHVPQTPLIDQGLLIQLENELQDELVSADSEVFGIHIVVFKELLMLLLEELHLSREQVLWRNIGILCVHNSHIR